MECWNEELNMDEQDEELPLAKGAEQCQGVRLRRNRI